MAETIRISGYLRITHLIQSEETQVRFTRSQRSQPWEIRAKASPQLQDERAIQSRGEHGLSPGLQYNCFVFFFFVHER